MKIFTGSGIYVGAPGGGGRGRPRRRSRHFQGRGKIRGKAAGFFGGVEHPLIERGADAAALGLVFDDDEAQEAASGGQTGAERIDAGEHPIEGEGHVVVLGKLQDGKHASSGQVGGRSRWAQFGNLLSQGEDAWLAGNYQQAMGRVAGEPA